MSTELKSRSLDYTLTRFAGPLGKQWLQITSRNGDFIQISQATAGFLISDLYDFVNLSSKELDKGKT